jgi:hypothetical protein
MKSFRPLSPAYHSFPIHEFVCLWTKDFLCETLGYLGEDRLVLDIVFVICLELCSDTVQSALEGIFGGGIDHLWLNGGSVLRIGGGIEDLLEYRHHQGTMQ